MKKRNHVGNLAKPGRPFTTESDTPRYERASSSITARDDLLDHGITVQYTDDETDSPEQSSSKGGLVFTCMLILKIKQ